MAAPNIQEFQQKIDKDVSEIKKIQSEMQVVMKAKQQLAEKKHENELVQTEFKLLEEDAIIYKLVGPILAKQETGEAKSNVEKRLEFLEKEINRTDTIIKDFEKKMDEKRGSVMKIQEEFKRKMMAAQQQQQQN